MNYKSLIEKGYAVFPLQEKGKKPLRGTDGVYSATKDISVAERLWTDQKYNVAIATGSISGIFVLDIDGEKGEDSFKVLKKEVKLPKTLEVKTGNGRQLYFKWNPSREVRNRQGFRPGLDIRGNGGYVVAPDSIHPNGAVYKFVNKLECVEAPVKLLDIIAPKKKNILPWQRENNKSKVSVKKLTKISNIDERVLKYLEKCEPAVQGSAGHNQLLKVAKALVQGFNLSESETVNILWMYYNHRCMPPWDMSNNSDKRDFERKVKEANKLSSDKPRGWLLEDSVEFQEMDVTGAEKSVKKLLEGDTEEVKLETIEEDDLDKTIKQNDIQEIIKDTVLEDFVKEFSSVMSPPLPIEMTLGKAFATVAMRLCDRKEIKDGNLQMIHHKGVDLAKCFIGKRLKSTFNFYIFNIFESGSGKDIGGLFERLNSEYITSGGSAEGVLDSLMDMNNSGVILRLSEMQNLFTKGHWESFLLQDLIEVYTNRWFKKNMSRRGNAPVRESVYCNLSLLGNIQPAIADKYFNQDQLDNGLLARGLMFTHQDKEFRVGNDDEDYIERNFGEVFQNLKDFDGSIKYNTRIINTKLKQWHDQEKPFKPYYMRLFNEYAPKIGFMLSLDKRGLIHEKDDNEQVSFQKTLVIRDSALKEAVIVCEWIYNMAYNYLKSASMSNDDKAYQRDLERVYHLVLKKRSIMESKCRNVLHFNMLKFDNIVKDLVSRNLIRRVLRQAGRGKAAHFLEVDKKVL